MQIASSSGGWRGPTWQITSLMLTVKIPECLIKFMFLVKIETLVRLGIKFKFGIVSFSTDAIWDLCFFV